MPTQQRPNRVLTESSADQFDLIRQLNFQKLVLAYQFLFARYFLRLAREVVPLYWHSLVVVVFDALFHQLDQVPGVLLSLFDFTNSQFRGISLTIKMTPCMEVDILFYYKIYCFYKHESMTKVGFLLKFHFYTMQNLTILQSSQ
ncbi:Hypothetical_protein [Hexamita inflata]|uniref:Hypothetical_protein n=1 Tax=Hexamita inflata TaxID=28002 RepID=A0ABP1JVD5_9EUKA